MFHLVKYLPHMYGDLILTPQYLYKSQVRWCILVVSLLRDRDKRVHGALAF